MRPAIEISEPCHLRLKDMPACKGGFYCGACEKKVTDLRKKSKDEVTGFIQQNPGACVVMDSKHAEPVKNTGGIKKMAAFLQRNRLRMVASVLLAFSLLLSSCHRTRRLMGCPAFKQPEPQSKEQHH